MSKRLLTILLLVSLFLNAGIIGGLFVMGIFRHNHMVHHNFPPEANRRAEDRQRLAPRLWEDPAISVLRDSFRVTKDQLMQELARETIDDARINAIIEQSVDAQGTMERALGHRLLQIRKTMNAKEAEEYFARRSERDFRNYDRRKPQ